MVTFLESAVYAPDEIKWAALDQQKVSLLVESLRHFLKIKTESEVTSHPLLSN